MHDDSLVVSVERRQKYQIQSFVNYTFTIAPDEAGQRLDVFMARKLPDRTRSLLGKLVREGAVFVNGCEVKAGYKIRAGDTIALQIDSRKQAEIVPEDIPLEILYEDDAVLVLSKPPGLVVHPGAGNAAGTLVNGLVHYCEELAAFDDEDLRPGIVHRLDKDTSGIMVAAKTEQVQAALSKAFKDREVRKSYLAILSRCPVEPAGTVTGAIGRHPVNRKKMAVLPDKGKYAVTHWEVTERFSNGCALVSIRIETGRTHQIRVHMASIGCPVLGDILYGGAKPNCPDLEQVKRQMLHSATLSFLHPVTRRKISLTAPLWEDMAAVLDQLRYDAQNHSRDKNSSDNRLRNGFISNCRH